MPLPEGYLPREGDELLIRVKVRFSVDAGETSVLIDRVTSVELNEIHANRDRHAWQTYLGSLGF